jgi:formylglycine-generating enzyme required for sulfatase activity
MSGTVREWCWDWHTNSFDTGTVTDPAGPNQGAWRVIRGGGWKEEDASYCAVSIRTGNNPNSGNDKHGFRVVCR